MRVRCRILHRAGAWLRRCTTRSDRRRPTAANTHRHTWHKGGARTEAPRQSVSDALFALAAILTEPNYVRQGTRFDAQTRYIASRCDRDHRLGQPRRNGRQRRRSRAREGLSRHLQYLCLRLTRLPCMVLKRFEEAGVGEFVARHFDGGKSGLHHELVSVLFLAIAKAQALRLTP